MTDRPHLLALDYIAAIDDPIRVTDGRDNPHLHYSAQHVKAAFLAGVAAWGESAEGQTHALLCDVLRHLTDDVGVVSHHMPAEDQRTFHALTDRIRTWLIAEADAAPKQAEQQGVEKARAVLDRKHDSIHPTNRRDDWPLMLKMTFGDLRAILAALNAPTGAVEKGAAK